MSNGRRLNAQKGDQGSDYGVVRAPNLRLTPRQPDSNHSPLAWHDPLLAKVQQMHIAECTILCMQRLHNSHA